MQVIDMPHTTIVSVFDTAFSFISMASMIYIGGYAAGLEPTLMKRTAIFSALAAQIAIIVIDGIKQ